MIEKIGKWVFNLSICIFSVCARSPQYLPQSQPERGPAIIHECVGEFIDAQEREFYNLFQGIEGFTEAVFFKGYTREFDILIISERHTYSAIYDAFNAGEILHDYIETFDEKGVSLNDFEKKWGVVDYDTLGLPITKNDVDRILAKHSISTLSLYSGCLGGCIGTCYGGRDVESTGDIYHNSFGCSGGEDIPFWCVGGCLAGVLIVHSFEQYFTKRNPVPYINKHRGPWVIE